MPKLYAERDIMRQDLAGNHYTKHVHAMTAEGLHSKSAIAAELAHRDIRIAELERMLCHAADNVGDLPISALWAEKFCKDVEELINVKANLRV